MEFIVNEQGCNNLSNEMLDGLNKLGTLISELEAMDGTLRTALGDDYESIGRNVSVMKNELGDAFREFKVIIIDMKEYMAKVKQIRAVINNGH